MVFFPLSNCFQCTKRVALQILLMEAIVLEQRLDKPKPSIHTLVSLHSHLLLLLICKYKMFLNLTDTFHIQVRSWKNLHPWCIFSLSAWTSVQAPFSCALCSLSLHQALHAQLPIGMNQNTEFKDKQHVEKMPLALLGVAIRILVLYIMNTPQSWRYRDADNKGTCDLFSSAEV